MPSRNPTAKLPVPWRGLMPDMHEYSVPPDGCIAAENVLVVDGSLRPRPSFDTTSIPNLYPHRVLSAIQWESDYDKFNLVAATMSKWYANPFTASGAWTDLSIDLVSGWTVHSGNVYKADVKIHPRKLWVDGTLGASKNSIAALTTNKDWYWDEEDKLAYLYDDTYNPDTYNSPGVEVGDLLTGSAEALTVFRTFERKNLTYLLGTNGTDSPKFWDGISSRYSEFQGALPSRAMIISANRCVLLGAGSDRLVVDVSDFNNFETGYGTVQQSLLGDTPGEIIAGLELNDLQHTVYKTDAIFRGVAQAEFYGVAAPFRYEAIATGVPGPVSPQAVTRMPDNTHVYLGEDGGLYRFDGIRPLELGRSIRHWITSTWQFDDRRQSWIAYDPDYRILWVFYPHASGGMQYGIAVVTDLQSGGGHPFWPVSTFPNYEVVAGADIAVKTVETIGDGAGHTIGESHESIGSGYELTRNMVFFEYYNSSGATETKIHNWAEDDYGPTAAADINFQTGFSDLGDPSRWKTVNEIDHILDFEGNETGVDFKLKSREYGEDEVTSSAQRVLKANYPRITEFRQAGRWFSLYGQMASIAGNDHGVFKWAGGVVKFRPRGTR